MRTYAVLAAILVSLPISFVRPFFGCLVWTWVAFMNPHRLAFNFPPTFPVAALVGAATLSGLLLSGEPKRLPRNAGTYLLIALFVCLTASTLVAEDQDVAFAAWNQRSKILLMALVIVMLVQSRERLRALCLVTAASIGFFGLKGGAFALLTGLQYRVYGPDGSFLGDNTSVALALCMVLPLLLYLSWEVEGKTARLLLRLTFVASVISVVSSYSRGGFLGLAAIILLLFVKNGRKLMGAAMLAVGVVCVVVLAPPKWFERMQTIEAHDNDNSAQARLDAWRLAWRLALARPLLGWGSQAMEDKHLYDVYYPDSPTRADVHSSYFELLAENGFLTFGVWCLLLAWCLGTSHRLKSRYHNSAEHQWIATYADMFFLSIVGYAVAGAFLEMAFFDLLYHIVGGTIVLSDIASRVDVRAAAAARAVRTPAEARVRPVGIGTYNPATEAGIRRQAGGLQGVALPDWVTR